MMSIARCSDPVAGPAIRMASNGFLARRWRGETPLAVLLWRDMLGVGSLVNLGATFFALLLAARGAPLGLSVALHFAPVPYNVFLLASLWRSSQRTGAAVFLGAAWFVVATFL